MPKVRDEACSCRPWGTCMQSVCSCASLCPDTFEIFKRPPSDENIANYTKRENSLDFRNTDAMAISSIRGTNGYCWGHASITTKFNRLAFFDPSDKRLRDNLEKEPGSPERKEALAFYKKAIDAIVANKATDLPGYENLHDISSDPDLQSYIADKVARSWADRAMTFKGVGIALSTRKMSRDDSEKFIKAITHKIDQHQQPQIVFTERGNTGRTHALLVSHYEVKGGRVNLCLRDNNLDPEGNINCEHRLFVDNDGGLNYPDFGEIGGAVLAHNDDADALAQFNALKERCHKDKECSSTKR